MNSNQRRVAWPYLFVLLGLFALSLAAPRAWNRSQTAESAATQAARNTHPAEEPLVATTLADKPVIERLPEVSEADGEATDDDSSVDAPDSSATDLGLMLVEPIRAFGRQVIDPIVEFAKRPLELRTLPDMSFPEFQENEQAFDPATVWTRPEALLQVLQVASAHPVSEDWAQRAINLVNELNDGTAAARPASSVLADLRVLMAADSVPQPEDPIARTDVARAKYALARRLEIWDRIGDLLARSTDTALGPAKDDDEKKKRIAQCLDDIERLTATIDEGQAWRDYLLVQQLRSVNQKQTMPQAQRQSLAEKILARLDESKLTTKQRRFVANSSIAALSEELQAWAAVDLTVPKLLADVERYESTQLASDARLVAEDCQSLQWASDGVVKSLAERLDLHYRNANVRVSMSPAFANRFVPQPTVTSGLVNDTIQGVPVYGRSTTFTSVSVRAIPDPRRIRLGLEASGTVSSRTESDAGPARFYNRAASSFLVRKLVTVGTNGLRTWPAVADADSYYSSLTDVETNFDIVPLVGSLVRNYARTQHDEAQPSARREMESKVAARARRQFDHEVQPRLEELVTKANAEVLEPLRRLGLDPTAIEMNSSADRLTVRARIAGDKQLGAHTPRPRAPSDCLLSVQVHQSAINNLLESLDLEGREFTIPELFAWIGKKLQRELTPPGDVPDDVVVRFADKNALHVHCVEGQMELAVAIDRLSHGRRRWREFIVRTSYEPDASSLDARLVRSGGIFLEGRSLQGRAEFVLRSILSKALSVDRPWRLVPEKVAHDPRMTGLEISQFVVEDGWIGLAYSPTRAGNRLARKPK